MANNVASLWPGEISQKVLSPRVILRAQAEALASQTGGILLAEINRREDAPGIITLDFTIVVPALGGYRHRLLRVAHREDFPYPALVDAEIFGESGRRWFQGFLETGEMIGQSFKADSEVEFIALIERVFGSTSVLSATQSLIARAVEKLDEKDEQNPPSSVSRRETPTNE